MRRILCSGLFCLSVAALWPQGESVDLSSVNSPEETPMPGLPLHLYTDFDLDFSRTGGLASSLVYVQNHREILIETTPGSPLLLEGDLLAPTNFFDVGFSLSLPFPFLGTDSALGSSLL